MSSQTMGWPVRTAHPQACLLCRAPLQAGGDRVQCDLCRGVVCAVCLDHLPACNLCEAVACPLCGGVEVLPAEEGSEFFGRRACLPCQREYHERQRELWFHLHMVQELRVDLREGPPTFRFLPERYRKQVES